eukprot:m.21147 g.21147  ORF g.21147 m.21147 type:complete len:740 (+) comp28143_c0_seq2:172-2391(+)
MDMAAYLPVERPLITSSNPRLDVHGLTPTEIAQIQQVLARAERANEIVAKKTRQRKDEYEHLKSQVEAAERIMKSYHGGTAKEKKNLCHICFRVNVGLTVSHMCCLCQRKFCSSCGCRVKTGTKPGTPMEWTCALCYKEHRYMSLSGDWLSGRNQCNLSVSPGSAFSATSKTLSRSCGDLLDCIGSELNPTGDLDSMGTCGRILIQLGYLEAQCSLIVTIICAEGLNYTDVKDRKCSINPYAKMYLLPEKSVKMKRRTATLQETDNPAWKRCFKYEKISPGELKTRSLEISVWSLKKQKPRNMKRQLGQVTIDLSEVPLDNYPRLYPLDDPCELLMPRSCHSLPRQNAVDGGGVTHRHRRSTSDISSRNSMTSDESSCSDEVLKRGGLCHPSARLPHVFSDRDSGMAVSLSSVDTCTSGRKSPLSMIGQLFRKPCDDVDAHVREYRMSQAKQQAVKSKWSKRSSIEEVNATLKSTGDCSSLAIPNDDTYKSSSLPRKVSLDIPEGTSDDKRRHSMPVVTLRGGRSTSPALSNERRSTTVGLDRSHLSPRRYSRVNETYCLSPTPSEDGSLGSTVSALHMSDMQGLGIGQLLRSAQIGVENSGRIHLGFSLANHRLQISVYAANDLVFNSEDLANGQANAPYVKLYLLHDTKPVAGLKEQRTKCGDSLNNPQFGQTLTFRTTAIHNKILKVKVKYDTVKKTFKRKSHNHEIGQALIALDDLRVNNEEVKDGWYQLFPSRS